MTAKHLKQALTIYIKQARFARNRPICFSFVPIDMNKLSMWLTMSLPSQSNKPLMSLSRASCYLTLHKQGLIFLLLVVSGFNVVPLDMSKFQPPLNGLISFKTSQFLYFLCHSSPQIMHRQHAVKKCQEKIKSIFINSKNGVLGIRFQSFVAIPPHPFVGIDLRPGNRISGLKGSTLWCLFPLASQLSKNNLYLYAMLVLSLI